MSSQQPFTFLPAVRKFGMTVVLNIHAGGELSISTGGGGGGSFCCGRNVVRFRFSPSGLPGDLDCGGFFNFDRSIKMSC